MTDPHTTTSPDIGAFSMRLIAQVCDGPAALRDRLVDAGLDIATVARAVAWAPRALARLRHGDATPRGVLVRLGALAVAVEQLRASGVPVDALVAPHDAHARAVIQHISDQSPIAAKVIGGVRHAGQLRAVPQLSLDLAA